MWKSVVVPRAPISDFEFRVAAAGTLPAYFLVWGMHVGPVGGVAIAWIVYCISVNRYRALNHSKLWTVLPILGFTGFHFCFSVLSFVDRTAMVGPLPINPVLGRLAVVFGGLWIVGLLRSATLPARGTAS